MAFDFKKEFKEFYLPATKRSSALIANAVVVTSSVTQEKHRQTS